MLNRVPTVPDDRDHPPSSQRTRQPWQPHGPTAHAGAGGCSGRFMHFPEMCEPLKKVAYRFQA